MHLKKITLLLSLSIAATLSTTTLSGKPLKVFIMAGQSNMQGKASIGTIERMNMTEDSRPMYQEMVGSEGDILNPVVVKDVYGVYYSASGRTGPIFEHGPMSPTYGKKNSSKGARFGPDYTFAIYLQKHLNEPFLIIKTAWGGKSLLKDFRPPSAGPLVHEKDSPEDEVGHYYRMMMKNVKEVLQEPGKYHPAYNESDGYEIAGFVWFQGFNDVIQKDFYSKDLPEGGQMYDEYTHLMAHFIRDVRKGLNDPDIPFLIGALGTGGPGDISEQKGLFQKAQVAAQDMPEFKGTVVGVMTHDCWDMELQRIIDKVDDACRKEALANDPKLEHKPRALKIVVQKSFGEVSQKLLTKEEMELYKVGQSNEAFHYMGSAYTYGKIGKLFADTMAEMLK